MAGKHVLSWCIICFDAASLPRISAWHLSQQSIWHRITFTVMKNFNSADTKDEKSPSIRLLLRKKTEVRIIS